MSGVETATWAVAIVTLLAVIVALFKNELISLWQRPVLKATIRLAAPDCHKTEMVCLNQAMGQIVDRAECYYLRLWVENTGNQRAERVQIFASKLLRRHADETFKEEKNFLPMNLRWAHSQPAARGPEIFAEGISPLMGKHCDLGHIIDPQNLQFQARTGDTLPDVPSGKTILTLDLEIAPNTRSHLLGPGVYRLVLKLAAANMNPIPKTLEITLTGDWYSDEAKMFSDGLGIKEIN